MTRCTLLRSCLRRTDTVTQRHPVPVVFTRVPFRGLALADPSRGNRELFALSAKHDRWIFHGCLKFNKKRISTFRPTLGEGQGAPIATTIAFGRGCRAGIVPGVGSRFVTANELEIRKYAGRRARAGPIFTGARGHEPNLPSARKEDDRFVCIVVSPPFSNRFCIRPAAPCSAVFRPFGAFYFIMCPVIGIPSAAIGP